MNNLILFLNAFLSYFLLFALVVVLVIIACLIGIKWRKSKNQKLAAAGEMIVEQTATDSENE
ncbi:MAG: hypothetical protein J6B68_07700 [Lachnospiraceae bacterium]|nr:hypothetical protein [Lachnospiraceae bacterium]